MKLSNNIVICTCRLLAKKLHVYEIHMPNNNDPKPTFGIQQSIVRNYADIKSEMEFTEV